MVILKTRRARVQIVVTRHLRQAARGRSRLAETLGRWTREPATGIPIFIVVMLALYYFVGLIGAGVLVGLPRGKPLRGADQPAGGAPVRPGAVALPPADVRRRVRPDHDGPDLRVRAGAADRRHLLPRLRPARGLRLPPPAGDHVQPALPADRPQRQGDPADGARPRLRHDGHDDRPHPGEPQGALHRDAAARPRRPVLGAARRDPRPGQLHLPRRASR